MSPFLERDSGACFLDVLEETKGEDCVSVGEVTAWFGGAEEAICFGGGGDDCPCCCAGVDEALLD